ncbi:hypothetical protein KKH36_02830 [Patescibacteria group bacterium]|nr:hypothetical protein [Patescibacteria group bacterium]
MNPQIADLIFMSLMLVTAVYVFWIAINSIIFRKKVAVFLPLIFSGFILCFSAVFSLYGIFDQKIWFVLESLWAVVFLWILIIIIKKNNV